MSKAVLISIQPKWCELIASGEKTVEVRKTRPKLETPFKCYIYCALGDRRWRSTSRELQLFFGNGSELSNGKVIGEFVCDTIDQYDYDYCTHPEIGMDYDCGDNWWEISDEDLACACLTESQFRMYAYPNEIMYGWHISDLVIFDKPKELREFYIFCDRCDEHPIRCEYGYEENTENGYYSECMCDFKRPIKRPPQSWCYVEELEGGGDE